MSQKNREAFRAGQDPASFLANELKGEMKVKLSEADFRDWVREASKLVKDYDPMEVADAMVWAIHESDFWSDWDFTMAKFAQYAERIIAQYRGAVRKKKALAAASGEQTYSATCLALMEKYPNWTRQQILVEETRQRMIPDVLQTVRACQECKGHYWVPSTRPNLQGAKVECKSCRDAKAKLFYKHRKVVEQELFGQAVHA